MSTATRLGRGAALAAAGLVLAACGGPADTAQGGGATSDGGQGERTYTVGYSATAGVADLGTLLTWEALEEKGISVETTYFSGPDVTIQALERGDIDMATNLAAVAALNAADAGLPVKIFTGYVAPEFVLGGTTDLESVEDLEGTRTSIHSEGGRTAAYINALVQKYGIEDLEILTIPNSSARAQALLQGQTDSGVVDLGDSLLIAAEDPGKFHTVLFFGEEFAVADSGTVATTDFLSENAEDVQVIVTTMIETYRKINDEPEWAVEQAQRLLSASYDDPELLAQIVEAYVERGMWDANGGLSEGAALETIAFNTEYTGLEVQSDDLSTYYDFSFVDSALGELGEH